MRACTQGCALGYHISAFQAAERRAELLNQIDLEIRCA
jgi:hypothetical protein